jgi:hypothetical protein
LNNLTLQNRFQIPEDPYEIRWRDANPADRLFPVRFPSPHHILHVQSAGSHCTTTVLHLQGIILALMPCMHACKCKLLQSIISSSIAAAGRKKCNFSLDGRERIFLSLLLSVEWREREFSAQHNRETKNKNFSTLPY